MALTRASDTPRQPNPAAAIKERAWPVRRRASSSYCQFVPDASLGDMTMGCVSAPRSGAAYPPLSGNLDAMDEDLEAMSREQLIAEARKLRAGIRAHRDSSGHELCWHHPELWGQLPERSDPIPKVPTWPEFLRGCVRYRESLDAQLPDAPRTDVPYEA
jgi:hypothetical protein